MKIWSIITFFVVLNFTALPSIAAVLGWDSIQTNVMVNEEETHSQVLVVYEKTHPKTMNVHEFIKFFETDTHQKSFVNYNENMSLAPEISIISPPPEA